MGYSQVWGERAITTRSLGSLVLPKSLEPVQGGSARPKVGALGGGRLLPSGTLRRAFDRGSCSRLRDTRPPAEGFAGEAVDFGAPAGLLVGRGITWGLGTGWVV